MKRFLIFGGGALRGVALYVIAVVVVLLVLITIGVLYNKYFPKDFREADLQQVLTQNSCWECNLRGADLTGADLSGKDLREADLSKANLTINIKTYLHPLTY